MRTLIELEHYKRRALYHAFKDRDLPVLSVTANVDITRLKPWLQARGERFFLPLSYLISCALNGVPELRHRIVDGQLYEYARVDPGFTVLLADETFSFCDAVHCDDYARYREQTRRAMDAVRSTPDLGTGDKDHMFFITSLPWLSFTAITHPFDRAYASIPVVSVGRYFRQGESLLLPVAIQVHHGLVDGLHVARFYQDLERRCADPGGTLEPPMQGG